VILRRVPMSMLVALGLAPIDACECPLGPCLKVAPVEEPEPEAHACLTAIPPDPDDRPSPTPPAKAEPVPTPPPEPPLHPCLSVPPPVSETGPGGGKGKPPSDEPFTSADVLERVLERGDLPPDVLARLRGPDAKART
jgi:hypothetical protein